MKDFDAIVIGSGAGGLTAAVALARTGRKVIVLEQHYLAGGYSQSFVVNGFRFSPGVHYIGALGPGGGLRRIYEGLGVSDDLVFFELNPDGYDHVVIGRERFDIPKGRDRFAARLKDRFPAEAAGIDRYFDLVGRMCDEIRQAAPVHGVTETAALAAHMPTTILHGMMPLTRFLDGCTDDPLLRAILSIQAGDHGMAPSHAPTVLHAAVQGYYFDGACYPRGGGHAIADAMLHQLHRHGGEIRLQAEVASILIGSDQQVLGVRLADGREIRADIVISNADPGETWGRLVPPEHVGWRLRHRVEHLRYSVSTISLFLAVDMDLRALGLDSGNVWFSRTPDTDAAYEFAARRELFGFETVPGLFFNATTLKDPTLRSDGLHTVEAMTVTNIDAFRDWAGLPPGERGTDYQRLKEELSERILEAIDCFAPGLGRHTVFRTLGTPLTNVHYVRATHGGIYGTEKTLGNLGPFGFGIETHLRGLYQCGASTMAPGINGVTHSGLSAAAAAVGCPTDELLTARGRSLRIYPAENPASWPPELQASVMPPGECLVPPAA